MNVSAELTVDIHRAEKIAQDLMLEANNGEWNKQFLLIDPGKGIIPCKWLDPYFGMFIPDDADGFMMTKDVPDNFKVLMLDNPTLPD